MTEGVTLTSFLLARIEEDEYLARYAVCQCGGPACTPELGWYHRGELNVRLADFGDLGSRGAIDFILAMCPSRVLAECKAKRGILEQRERIDRNTSDSEWAMGYSDANYDALQTLAQPYADHPDFREEWRL